MFDIGFQEILLVSILALLVMGPERLPGAIRTGSLWIAKMRRSFAQMKEEIENEIGFNAEDIRRQLHNESILKSIEESKKQLQDGVDKLKPDFQHLEHGIKDIVTEVDPASEATPPAFSRAAQQAASLKAAALAQQAEQSTTEAAQVGASSDYPQTSQADTSSHQTIKPKSP